MHLREGKREGVGCVDFSLLRRCCKNGSAENIYDGTNLTLFVLAIQSVTAGKGNVSETEAPGINNI